MRRLRSWQPPPHLLTVAAAAAAASSEAAAAPPQVGAGDADDADDVPAPLSADDALNLVSTFGHMQRENRNTTTEVCGWTFRYVQRPPGRGGTKGDMYVQPPGGGAVIRSLVGLKRRLGMAPPPSQSTFGPAPSPGGGSRRSRADGGGGATPGGARSPGGGNWLARHAPARGAAGDVLTLSVGLAVRARYRATALGVFGTQWFDGEVRAVHDDGTCDVLYEDGDVELRVAPHYVKELVLYNLGPRYQASVPPWRGTPPPSAGTDERPEPELVDSKDEHDAVCRSTAAALTAAAYDVEAWPLRDESDDDEVGVEGGRGVEEEEEGATEEVATAAVAPPKPKPPKPRRKSRRKRKRRTKRRRRASTDLRSGRS